MSKKQSIHFGRLAVLIVVIALVAVAVVYSTKGKNSDVQVNRLEKEQAGAKAVDAGVAKGQIAPDFTATTITNESYTYDKSSGKPLWLIFNATWCSSCRAEVPEIKQAADDPDVEVVSVYLSEAAPTVSTFAKKLELTHTQIPDPDSTLAKSYGANAVPTHLFIDANGKVLDKHVGAMTDTEIEASLKLLTQ